MATIIQCSCGKRIPTSRLFVHRRSVLHRQRNRLLRLLAQPQVTFREIARQTGVSGERIRQIAAEAGIKGRERSRLHTLNRRLERWRQYDLIKALPRDLDVVSVLSSNHLFHSKLAMINGHRCLLSRYGEERRRPGVYSIHPTYKTGQYDFQLYYGPLGWLVFPWHARPRTTTGFTARPHGGVRRRHDFLDYLDRWDWVAAKPAKSGKRKGRGQRTPQAGSSIGLKFGASKR
jgi:hypothetical protein